MNLVESIKIKHNKELDVMSLHSKNLYNQALFLIKKELRENKKWLRYQDLNKILKDYEEFNNYKLLPAQTAQNILKVLDTNWASFFKAIKVWKVNPDLFEAMPKPPDYKRKDGRFILIYPFQNLRVDKDSFIKIPRTNFKFQVRDKIKNSKIRQVRIIPKYDYFKIEVVYEVKDVEVKEEIKNCLSIDLGVNNLATCIDNRGNSPFVVNGRGVKAINQYYNKKQAKMKSELRKKNDRGFSHKLSSLTSKRTAKIDDYFHKTSRFLIDYCVDKKIDTIIIGKNDGWKQNINLGKKTNQKFVQIPFNSLISKIEYKAKLVGIKVVQTEESYTSKVDHFAFEKMEHQKKYLGRRKKRGLFQSSTGVLLNADVNGAVGIMRKVIGDDFIQPIEGLVFNPVKMNLF